jgi:CSLREA domain-containing protein
MAISRPSPLVLAALLFLSSTVRAATFVVDSTGDESDDNPGNGICHTAAGTCTLRAAIEEERLNTGPHVIHFNIPGAGVHTIRPTFSYLVITQPVTIDGYSQPGSSVNTLAAGDDAVLLIELDGSLNGGIANGLTIQTNGCTIKGLVINRFTNPSIVLDSVPGAGGNTVQGNFLGTNPAGTAAAGNAGIGLWVRCPNNTIGGPNPADRNVISATRESAGFPPPDPFAANLQIDGTSGIPTTGNLVQGNYIGTDASGMLALSSSNGAAGIAISTANSGGFTIGGTAAGERNVIAGNAFFGVDMASSPCSFPTTNVVIEGNWIGVNAAGAPLGNGYGGVHIGCNSSNNTVGGTVAGSGNVIAYNGASFDGAGVRVDILGRVGASSGPAGVGNRILGNSIFANTSRPSAPNQGLGIDLIGNGPTPNDVGDGDTGPNNLQNFPVLTNVTAGVGTTTIQGTLNSNASRTYRIEFFSNTACDPTGFGEGETFLGTIDTTTDAGGNASFSTVLPVTLTGPAVTATATDLTTNDTSEFCSCRTVAGAGASFFTVTPCRVADTRNPTGPYGGPALAANGDRAFVIAGQCGIPSGAVAVAFNFTVTQSTALGDLRTVPGGGTLPLVSTMNWRPGQTRANNAILSLGPSGDIVVHVDQASGSVQLIIDVNGYFQ